ncbi:egl-4 [Symbiodinium pilosum]|uniref:Egl-4 protein n=1 Tax=Symbiodinium pilosum TaxID=2952 RepID=A0A812TBL8_SYMPI|nr:egl-4 [Symbiodinium pilosum]
MAASKERALWLMFGVNSVLTGTQIFCGVLANSLSLLGDGALMAMDGVSYAVSLYAERRKASAQDAKRLDRAAAFFSATMLAATTAWVLFDVVERLTGEERESALHSQLVNGMDTLHDIEVNSDIMIGFTSLNLAADVAVVLCTWSCGASKLLEDEEASNLNLFGALAHLGADVVRGLAVLLAGILAEVGLVQAAKADAYCSLFVCIFVLAATASPPAREALQDLYALVQLSLCSGPGVADLRRAWRGPPAWLRQAILNARDNVLCRTEGGPSRPGHAASPLLPEVKASGRLASKGSSDGNCLELDDGALMRKVRVGSKEPELKLGLFCGRMEIPEDHSPRSAGSGAHSPPLLEPVNEISRGLSLPLLAARAKSALEPLEPLSCCSGLIITLKYFKESIVNMFVFRNWDEERDKFEHIVNFLVSVPLFKKQLPPCELPKVAQLLEEKTWPRGSTLVAQGDIGDTFFMIYEGQAALTMKDDQGQELEVGVLSAGDYIGGRAIVTEQRHMATVVALGELVTLSMSKQAFEQAGLKARLHFPKRPAIEVGGGSQANLPPTTPLSPKKRSSFCMKKLDESQQTAIIKAMRHNPNFRAFVDGTNSPSEQSIRDIVSSSEMRTLKAGEAAATFGDLGHEFFVIEEGSIEVIISTGVLASQKQQGQGKSAAAAAATFSMADRIRRKQDFLMKLHIPVVDRNSKRAKFNRSCSVLTKDPREEELEITGSGSLGVSSVNTTFAAASFRGKQQRKLKTGSRAEEVEDKPKEKVISTLHAGDSFGELSLLYNIRREATFRAAEDTKLFVINRKIFKEISGRDSGRKKFKEYCDLLDEVDSLTPLLRSERMELAAFAQDMVAFDPNQRVLFQGKVRQKPMWYVIFKGTAVLSQSDGNESRKIAELPRGNTFGERSLLRAKVTGQCISEVSVDAGPEGLTCLTFDGELICDIFTSLSTSDASMLPDVNTDVCEWEKIKTCRSRQKLECSCSLHSVKEVCRLGQGAFGTVFLVEDEPSQERYALKRVSKGHALRTGTSQSLCWERDLLNMLDSNFIVRLHKTMRDHQFVYFLLEAALGGDLYGLFSSHQDIFLADQPRGFTSAFYAGCVIAALEHLHERKIIYRDLKPENIMLDTRGYGKVCDMGLARFVVGKTNTQAGTPDYMAPEMIDPPHYHDNSADWWSLGVLMYEMLCQQLPFDDEELEDTGERLLAIRRSQENRLNFPAECPPEGKAFIAKLLRKLPLRLGAQGGAEEVRGHYFFKDFDFTALEKQTLQSPVERPWKGSKTTEPEVASPWIRGPEHLAPGEDEIFESYEDDGSQWDQEF